MKTIRRAPPHLNVYPQAILETFRHTLLRMRDLACAELGGLVERVPEAALRTLVAAGAPKAADQPLSPAYDAAKAEQERLLAYMDALEGALERMAKGRYGLCIICGNPISKEQLEGLPCVERCSQCIRGKRMENFVNPAGRLT